MGEIKPPEQVLLLTSAFSRYPEALDWAKEKTVEAWGELGLVSDVFDFVETNYYEPTMGPGLKKLFFTYQQLVSPEKLPEVKRLSNALEEEYAALGKHPESRPLNLDPGYLMTGKLVLASTKDHAHRIYLSDGIYGEVTLKYQHGGWRQTDWTFPDYRRQDYHRFLTHCREWLLKRLREDDPA